MLEESELGHCRISKCESMGDRRGGGICASVQHRSNGPSVSAPLEWSRTRMRAVGQWGHDLKV